MTVGKSPILRIAIVSDVHAFVSSQKSSDSVVDLSGSTHGSANPLTDLTKAIRENGISADVLVVAGDLCNQADFGGLQRAWAILQELRDELNASEIIATCGNHDLDSRHLGGIDDPDPKGALLSLEPPFPFLDEALNNKFWARNYAITKTNNDVVFVSLNTSAFHGGAPDEIEHGRVSQRTIDALARELPSLKHCSAHILVCHHHPMPLSGWEGRVDYGYVKRGQVLLDTITQATGSSWVIIHGHRHVPRLIYGASSSNDVPFVFGAGSLGARIAGVPNQFHLMDLFQSNATDHGTVVGTVRTWFWTDSAKWKSANMGEGMPTLCGFGYRGKIRSLATQIGEMVGTGFLNWNEVRAGVPSVDFLLPDSMRQLESELEHLGINILRHRNGQPIQVGR